MSGGEQSSGNGAAEKAPDAFRTISEVADELDLPQHVLRFWETRFTQIKPLKRGGGRRYYRPQDVELLRGIRHLLYSEGYTIRGVQRILREQGPRFVIASSQGLVEGTIAEPVMTPPSLPEDDDGAGAMARRLAMAGGQGKPAPQHHQPTPEREPARPAMTAPAEDDERVAQLSPDEVRRLEATLSDLLEMKRLLDQAR